MSVKERIQTYLQNGLTVAELKELLEEYPDDMRVVFAYNSGDHWRTEVAEYAQNAHPEKVYWSGYHDKLKLDLDSENDDEGDDDLSVEVLVIS